MVRIPGVLVVVALSFLLAACAGQGRTMTYAEVQTLNQGASACWVLAEYPGANVTRWPNGTPKTARYRVRDLSGRRQSLELEFDQCGVLVRKCYSGPVLRPPPRQKPKPPQPCAPPRTGCTPGRR